MGQLVSDRVCYKHGSVKPENKVIELYAFCDCGMCNYRKASINNGLKNQLTVTIENENKMTEAKEFIRNWKCGKKEYTSKIEYVHFY